MNHELNAASDMSRTSMPVAPGIPSSPDAIAQLGSALAALNSKVANRQRELNRLFEQIAHERRSLLDAVLDRLFEGFAGVIPFDTMECAFLSEDGATVLSYWMRGSTHDAAPPAGAGSLEGRSLSQTLASGTPLIVNDLCAHTNNAPRSGIECRMIDEGARSMLTCPLIADGTPLGFLFFTSRRPDAFTELHARAFQRAATQVSVVVQRTRAYGEVISLNRTLIRETRHLKEAATTDGLTGVLNRRALDAVLQSAWDRYEREQVTFGVILCDLDHFKQVNDTHGHVAGDRVLARAAGCLARGLRGGDAFGRFGGEEFEAVVVDTPSEATLGRVALRLRRLLQREAPLGLDVTASFGVASCHRFASLDEMLQAADRALYDAKAGGRNRCVLALSMDDRTPLQDIER